MSFVKVLVCNISLLTVQTPVEKFTEIINIDSGPIQGVILENVLSKKEYSAFKGIPYAEPPIGRLRFKAPVEPKPWTNLLSATNHGNICAQKNNGKIVGSEDCLYLNVYTPVMEFNNYKKELKPVFVFIYGGAFMRGHGNSDNFGPDFLVDKDIILVTFNYRLGPLGFLNLQHPEIPGNAGLKDQNFVLKWVKKNIAKFGGDPDNVTIGGQSAGAVSVDMHLISNSSRDLFHKSLAMSGSVFSPWAFHTFEIAKKNALKLGRNINNGKDVTDDNDLIKLLCNSSLEVLMGKSSILPSKEYLQYQLLFAPSIEKKGSSKNVFLDKCFVNKFTSGDFHNGPHMMGFTNMEAAAALSILKNIVKSGIDNFNNLFILTALYLKKFRRTKRENFISTKLKSYSEQLFSTGIDLKQKYMFHFRNNESIYYYYNTYEYFHKHVEGTRHNEDLLNIFYKVSENQPLDYFTSSEQINHANKSAVVRNRVVTMLANFVKYGNPTPRYVSPNKFVNVTWTTSNQNGGYLEIGNELIMHSHSRPISNDVVKMQTSYNQKYSNNICVPLLKEIVKNSLYDQKKKNGFQITKPSAVIVFTMLFFVTLMIL